LAFAIRRYRKLKQKAGQPNHDPDVVAKCLWDTAIKHVNPDRKDGHQLYRIFFYDCPPYDRGSHNPLTNRYVDFARSDLADWRNELHAKLLSMRSVALRRGVLLADRGWVIKPEITKALVRGEVEVSDLNPDDLEFPIRQKQVDMKLGMDIAALSYKRLVDRIVLIAGDADFVPAAKLARREGIDFILDPLWSNVPPSLAEHIDGIKSFWKK
jgi:uncharacterized LabA/DUF88 family protein